MATVTVRTYTFTGLSVATSYDFDVLAVNDQGIAPDNHAARLTATTASGGMHISQLNTLLPHCLTASSLPSLPLPLPSLTVPSSPTLRVVLPRFSNTYLVWSDPEPFVGPITGFQIRYLIDSVPRTIPELGGGVHQYSVSSIKGSEGKTHSVSLRAKTAAGYGDYSDPVVFTFQPIGEELASQEGGMPGGRGMVLRWAGTNAKIWVRIQWNIPVTDTLSKEHLSEGTVCCPNHIELCTNLRLN